MHAAPPIEDTPFSVAPFEPHVHVAPLDLFGRLRSGSPPLMVDLRAAPSPTALRGTVSWTTASGNATSWPFGNVEAILIDDDGSDATQAVRRLRAAGRPNVRALYGGLRLYAFTLHPAVVRDDRFLHQPEVP